MFVLYMCVCMHVREYVYVCVLFLQAADVLVESNAIWLHVDPLCLVNTGLNNTPGSKRQRIPAWSVNPKHILAAVLTVFGVCEGWDLESEVQARDPHWPLPLLIAGSLFLSCQWKGCQPNDIRQDS